MGLNIPKAYEAHKYEDQIYKKWESSRLFTPKIVKGKKPFVISMPPPNATGSLHLGHATMLAIEDIMIRYSRMKGTPSLWLPGTDHASIATQNKVEQLLAGENLTRHSLGREKFLERVHDYVKNSQHVIRNQIRKMGASCDWSRERYTLDPGLSQAVREVFIRMYHDGLIYRGNRIVNWCTRCSSTLADDEVEYKEQFAKLYTFKYDKNFPFEIATTRPETKLGDTAVAVHPDDERYKKYIGKTFTVSFAFGVPRKIRVIADEQIDPTFGTGALGVTPAHSQMDFELAQKHELSAISVIDEEGKILPEHPKYSGLSVLDARKEIIRDLEEQKLMKEIQEIKHNLSICYRCQTPIEPLISKQWFVDVNKKFRKGKSLKDLSLEVVRKGKIKILPERFTKTYFHWMENLRDWCISRQIWFGHQIPVWYCDCEAIIVPKKAGETPKRCSKCKNMHLKQDPDTLDTWFSSGLWTFSTLGWPEETKDLAYFHPTSVLETGYDILFFWVARMILMTTYALKEIPFHTVYLHGLVRDKQGRKMSKSLGNGIDPLDMIAKYGTDAVRLSLSVGGGAGNDIRLFEEKIAGYRNFVNKIWNAARFAFLNVTEEDKKRHFTKKSIKSRADKWIVTELQKLIRDVTKDIENHQFSESGLKIYDFTWSLYCDWYLEISKGEHLNPAVLIYVLKTLLKMLHPFVPFVTEVLWQELGEKTMLIQESWLRYDKSLLFPKEAHEMSLVHDIITRLRTLRAQYNIEPAKKIDAIIYAGRHAKVVLEKAEPIKRLARIEKLEIKEKGPKLKNALTAFLHEVEIYVPFKELFNVQEEIEHLKKGLETKLREWQALKTQLKNKNFIERAPSEIVAQTQERSLKLEQEVNQMKEHLSILSGKEAL